ncbi:leucyl aminopeptidase [Propionimicrobium sp. PCR01-08-3]|uniref:leucyl aminopeptidase n=1 Tax=Propionimicrobium sp. PCR01-08-3 TaxID=3052086 RepID=UPI00255D0DD3|nr:leucyl aminopeptidase [Propionimicrobium sp. PCR01-08-3]WIY81693.1 leucyl aminopeptidase [Propionimicrobium sp. PCR01-08-3]
MATQPLFDSSRFDPERVALPGIESVRGIGKADAAVIGVVESNRHPTLIGTTSELESKAAKAGGGLLALLSARGATGEVGEVTELHLPALQLVAVGMGDDLDLRPEDLRRAAGLGVRQVMQAGSAEPRRIVISLDAGADGQVQAVAEGALLAASRFRKLSRVAESAPVETIGILGSNRSSARALAAARITAQAVAVARDWTNLPPNLLGPSDLAEQARGYLKDSKVELEILDEKALDKQGFGGILAVGGGSARPPRLLRLDYRPRGTKRHLVLVGKGITYDSGGFNLKPADSLLTMKHDMAGAADVIAATRAIAELGLGVHVTAYAPLAESMISGSAYRPGDVITTFDGTTVENTNSDCEGRIVLADALARTNQDDADMVVDIATLTGACVVALGPQIAGLMTSDDATADRLLDAAEAAGEEFWQLPITEHVRKLLPSPVADLRSKADRNGGALFAGAFLQHFVAEGTSWAHLDIAGPAWNASDAHDYVPAHATGMGVRTLIELAKSMAG